MSYDLNISTVTAASPSENENEWRDLVQWLAQTGLDPTQIGDAVKGYLDKIEEVERKLEEGRFAPESA